MAASISSSVIKLSLIHIWDTLKLAVSHDDGVVVTSCNPGAELLSVMGLKVLFGGD